MIDAPRRLIANRSIDCDDSYSPEDASRWPIPASVPSGSEDLLRVRRRDPRRGFGKFADVGQDWLEPLGHVCRCDVGEQSRDDVLPELEGVSRRLANAGAIAARVEGRDERGEQLAFLYGNRRVSAKEALMIFDQRDKKSG